MAAHLSCSHPASPQCTRRPFFYKKLAGEQEFALSFCLIAWKSFPRLIFFIFRLSVRICEYLWLNNLSLMFAAVIR
jgi:hypothetical protein